jgi:hypothetical protein
LAGIPPIFYRLTSRLAGLTAPPVWESYGKDKKRRGFLTKFTNKRQNIREFFNKLPILSCKVAQYLV